MRFSDTTLGAFFLLYGVLLTGYAWQLPDIPGQQYGAATFPLLISIGFIACSLRLLYEGIRQGKQPWVNLTAEVKSPRALAGVATTLLLVIFYIFFAQSVGFIPTAILMTFIMFLILKVHPVKAAILAIIAAFACDFIFRTMLLVPLPSGLMPRLPW